MDQVAVRVPATTANLGPGFDALGAAVSRHLVVGTLPRGHERVRTRGEGHGDVAVDDDNLIWRSLVRFCDTTGAAVPDVSLDVVNDIPLERGLGSSSAAIVAGLALGRALTGVSMGDPDLVGLAAVIEGHPDNVAPAVLGGFVSCTTRADGGLVLRRAQPVAWGAPLVAVPPTRQNTQEARGVLPAALDRADVATQAGRAVHVAGGLTGTWPVDPGAAGDLLHEPPRLAAMSASGALVEDLRSRGVHAWLSGAGPTIAALVPKRERSRIDEILVLVADHGFDGRLLDWDLAGVLVCPEGGCAVSAAGGCATCPRTRL
jgi:homoserine kinase